MAQNFQKEIVQHIVRNLLDIQLLRIIQAESTWGYKIKRQVETDFNIKIRHGDLYPTLNMLETKGLEIYKRAKKRTATQSVHTNNRRPNLSRNILQHHTKSTNTQTKPRLLNFTEETLKQLKPILRINLKNATKTSDQSTNIAQLAIKLKLKTKFVKIFHIFFKVNID